MTHLSGFDDWLDNHGNPGLPTDNESDESESTESQALTLLKEAFFIRQHGERAPGGNENWRDWERKTELYLRSLLAAECSHRDISWHGSRGECQDCGQNIPPTY